MARLKGGAMTGETVWIVGCGNMGRAMLDRWLDTGLDPASVTVIDPALPVLRGDVTVVAMPPSGMPSPTIMLLAVKPQMLDSAGALVAPYIGAQTLLISILAGVTIDMLRARFPMLRAVVRAMPNLPVAIGAGVVALYGGQGPVVAGLDALMAPLGALEWLEYEAQFDAVTALSGSGPAFVCRFIEAMAAGGAALGLAPEQAARMALATVKGTSALLHTNGEAADAMARRVTSKGGTTQAGLAVLDSGGEFVARVAATLDAAATRSAELASGG
jgi:pyrroline-5-carboxylate reductase